MLSLILVLRILAGALAFSLTWRFGVSLARKGYEEGFIQTLMGILVEVVTGGVIIYLIYFATHGIEG